MSDSIETWDEQVERLTAMAADVCGLTWDLSPNDRAAISNALTLALERCKDADEIDRLREENERMRAVIIAQAEAWDAVDAGDENGQAYALDWQRWYEATDATEDLGCQLRGAR